MPVPTLLEAATGGYSHVQPDWMPATRVRAFIFDDPALVWLEFHGREHGFEPDESPYEFLDFISEKAREFEEKWVKETAPGAVRVCREAYEVGRAEKVRETFTLMQEAVPVLYQPALWWAPERIYGVPDLLVHTSWLNQEFPGLLGESERQAVGTNPRDMHENGYYVVFDVKFTTRLDETSKAKDLQNYAAQVRIYSYILGHLQGVMPEKGFLITRDRIKDPLSVTVNSTLNQPLDKGLAGIRDQFIEIKLNGAKYRPWRDEIVVSNIAHPDDRWRTAKGVIAREKVPGGDAGLLYQVGPGVKRELSLRGFPSLDSMLQVDPGKIPFGKCKTLGPEKSRQIRAILQANRSGTPVPPPASSVPPRRSLEFYVDFEYFTNVNVDFERQWPDLEGCEMIFMIGLGWEKHGDWNFQRFAAAAEDHDHERLMLDAWRSFLEAASGGAFIGHHQAVLYHWTSAEVWQAGHASDRHGFSRHHPLRRLPWVDLQKVFKNDGPCGVPGAWNYGLKEVAKALGKLNPEFDPQWPGDLDAGLRAMVMGWRAYEKDEPLQSEEMGIITEYLEADCKALWKILKWLRARDN